MRLTPFFFSEGLESDVLRPVTQAPHTYIMALNKNPGHQGLVSFPAWQHLVYVNHTPLLGDFNASMQLHWEDNWKLAPGFS